MVTEMQCEYPAVHECGRFCIFTHQFGNLYMCVSSGKHHICDQNCKQRVNIDAYTQVCRMSKKVFIAETCKDLCGFAAQKRSLGPEVISPTAKRQHC